MGTLVQVTEKNVYGNNLLYPVNETALLLAKLGKTTTFTDTQLSTIRALGYQVTLVVNSARGL